MKDKIFIVVIIWLVASVYIWMFRLPAFGKPADCEVRYLDFIFPLTRIHCPVGGK